jgi:hypothetical protein
MQLVWGAKLAKPSETEPRPETDSSSSSSAAASAMAIAHPVSDAASASVPAAAAPSDPFDNEYNLPAYAAAALRWPLPPRADPLLVKEASSFLQTVRLRVRCDIDLVNAATSASPEIAAAAHERRPAELDLQVYLGETVLQVKSVLAERLGVGTALVVLQCGGRVMVDPLSLNDSPEIASAAQRGDSTTITASVWRCCNRLADGLMIFGLGGVCRWLRLTRAVLRLRAWVVQRRLNEAVFVCCCKSDRIVFDSTTKRVYPG